MSHRGLAALWALSLTLIACQTSGGDTAEEEIRALHESALVALRNADLDRVVAVYADEVVSLPPGQAALVGKLAVRSMWEGVLASFAVDVSVDIQEVQLLGDWAYERGTYHMELRPKGDGPVITDHGKYLDVLRRLDGQWRYWRVSWNSSQQAQ